MLFSYFSRFPKRSSSIRTKGDRRSKPRVPVHLHLERLEERLTPSVTVTRTSDNATFSTIQAAINDAGTVTGTTLLVSAGTDAENVNINKSIILEGAQHGVDARNRTGAETVMDATSNSGDTPFDITANNVTIDGFTVENATSTNVFGYGIVEGGGTSGTQILNNIIQDNIAGLSLANSPAGNAGLIQHNLFQNNNQAGSVSGTAIYTDQFNAGGNLANVTIDANAFSNNQNAGVIIGSTNAAVSTATNLTISNNTFNTEGNAVLLFNTTSSAITNNTITNSSASQVVIGGGVNGLQVTGNLIQNGATIGIRVGNFGGGGTNQNVTVSLNNIQGNTVAGLEIDSASASFTGTLNAMCNWWGAISGPTITSNPGGLGQALVDPNNQVAYRTWLIYGTDADTIAPGFQLPATINVTEGGDISPADNDYTRLANAIGCVQSGQTLVLSGTFDWTAPLAAAAWAKGNDAVAGTTDDYTITAPLGVSSVTLTAASLGGATIQGPGSLTNSGVPAQVPGFLAFTTGPDRNWTISNLQIFDFNIGIEYGNGIDQNAFNGTTITNNHIRVPAPLNQTAAPNALPVNTGINFSWGSNQTVSNNQIDLNGGAGSDSAGGHFAEEIGIVENTGGGTTYNGLHITGNTVNVLNAQAADPERVIGIWENGNGTQSNITVSGNKFLNLAVGNNPALNQEIAFRLTSPSSATTTILYQNNQASGAFVGFRYYPTYNNTGTPPVQLVGNTLTDVFDGFDFANGAKTVNYLSGNTANGTGSAGTGIGVGAGSILTTDGVSGTNAISGFATGVDINGGTATLQQNTISVNGTGVSVENSGTLTATTQNFIRNNTGDGISIAATAGTVGAVTDNGLSGNGKAIVNAASALLDASLNWWGSNTRAGVQAAISSNVDYTPFLNSGLDSDTVTPGFQGDFSTLDVDIQSPQAGATGRILEGINDVLAGGTVNVLSGTYTENVTIAKNLTLAGAANNPPITIIHPVSGDGVTINAPATNVTVENLEITGAVNGVNTSGVATVTLQNLTLDGDSAGLNATTLNSFTNTLNLTDLTLTGNAGVSNIANVTTINYTPLSGNTGASSTITGHSLQRGSDEPIIYSGVSTLNVFGSDGSDTFNVTPGVSTAITVSGGLPNPPATPGDVLNVNVTGTTNPTLTDTFNPASGFSGSYTFGNADAVNFNEIETLTPAAPSITNSDTVTFTVGQAGTFQVTTNASPPATLTEMGTLPAGVAFTDNGNGTATLAGTPAAGSGGIYPFTITASNGVMPNATQNFTLTVNEAPTITSSHAATFMAGQAGTFTVTTGHDFPTATTLSETGALPSGVTFTDNHNGTATLAGTPAAGSGGIFTFTITASNGVAPDATQNFTLTVTGAPAITSGNTATFLAGQANTFQVTTTGVPPASLTETGALPAGVTLTDNHNGTATLAGTPAAGSGGIYTFTITASNGVAPNATQNFTLTVNAAPTITSSNATTFLVGHAGTFTVTTGGDFPTTTTLSETGALPGGVTFTNNGNGTATLAGTPAAGSGGIYAFTITASNGVAPNATQNFTLTVNEAPAFTSANTTTFIVGTAGTFTVTATGTPTPTLSESGTLPSGVTFNATTGKLSGTPAAGTAGSYPITFTASNGVTPDATQNFTLVVSNTGTAPAFTSANTTTFIVSTAGTFTVTATGTPTPTLSESGTLPSGVTFNATTGKLSGTPAAGTAGSYPITFTASNGIAPNATQNFTLIVSNTGTAPAFTSPGTTTFTTTELGSFTVTATGAPTPTLSESGTLPSGVTFNATTGALSGAPLPGTNGTYPITFTASNGVGTNATQSFTLTVNSPIDELGAYRASNGSWSLDSDGVMGFNSATDQVFFSFSPPGVFGVAGDWTGSGTSKIGDFSNGVWHLDLNNNGVLDPGETFTFGQAGDQPVVGDWTGNGVTNIGVFRAAPDGITGEFILDTNGDHIMDAGDETFTFGLATDRIVVGDWNGDGKTKVGVFRDAKDFIPADAGDAVFSLDTNGNHTFDAGDQVFVFGFITDGLIVGDWNGGGKSLIGVYRDGSTAPVGNPLYAPGTALFSLDSNGDGAFDAGDAVFLYGLSSDQFVSGHWAKTPPVQPVGTPQAQFSANGQGPGGVAALTQAQLQPVLDQAIAAWMADGASATQLEAVNVQIGTLNDNLVGETSGNQITLDSTADGWGWNTGSSNADFTSTGADGLQAAPGSPAAGKMDLLTVVEHELGHELGLSDVNPTTHPTSLMASTLPAGTRRTVGS